MSFKEIKIIDAFLSAPSDTTQECEAVFEICNEINEIWSRHVGVRYELGYYKDFLPGVSVDAQSVINSQIQKDLDLYIGLMSNKIGTPTSRAASGTIEEFEHAFKRHLTDPMCTEIMFYFKSHSESKDSGVKSVLDFKNRVGELGVFYKIFKNIDDFKPLIRVHLSKFMQKFSLKQNVKVDEINTDIVFKPKRDDYVKNYERSYTNVLNAFSEITEVIRKISEESKVLYPLIFNKSQNLNARLMLFDRSVSQHINDVKEKLKIINKEKHIAFESFSKILMWTTPTNILIELILKGLNHSLEKHDLAFNKIFDEFKKYNDGNKGWKALNKRTNAKLKNTFHNIQNQAMYLLDYNKQMISLVNLKMNQTISKY